VTDGDHFPASPATDQLFRLWEHEVSATARAGASKASSVGVAGALALNIVTNTTEAVLQAGASATLGGSAVVISALSNEYDYAKASGKAEVGSATGVGASVALQVLVPSTVRAEAENGAALSGGSSVTVDAFGFRDIVTTAEGGTAGGTAVTPVVALLVSKDDHVTARLGTGSALSASGAVKVTATHLNRIRTEGNAEAAGKDTAVGIDISINVAVGWQTTAEIARNVTGSSVDVVAFSEIKSEAKAVASAKGGSESDPKSGDQNANSQVNGDNPNTKDQGTGTLPSSSGGTNGSNGANGANGKASSESGSGGGGTGVAGAIAVNWVVMVNTARITASRTVTATAGAVTVRALSHVDANARAMGSAIDLQNDTGVGAAIGLNVQDLTSTATIGAGAVVSGSTGIIVEAITPAGERNDFIVWGIAAGGGKNSAGVAASAGVQILLITTTASVGKGAQLTSAGGGVAVRATESMGLQLIALSGGFSTGSGTAVGGAVAVNYLEVTTKAFIDSGTAAGQVTSVDAAGTLTIAATATLVPLEPETPLQGKITLPSVTNVAVGAGASNSGAAGSCSLIRT